MAKKKSEKSRAYFGQMMEHHLEKSFMTINLLKKRLSEVNLPHFNKSVPFWSVLRAHMTIFWVIFFDRKII